MEAGTPTRRGVARPLALPGVRAARVVWLHGGHALRSERRRGAGGRGGARRGRSLGGGPVLPRVVLGDVDPAREEDRDLLVLVRGLRVPRGLPAPAHPARGLLTALRDGDRVVVLAFGSDALRPLGQGYFLGRVKGRAALVRPNGAVRVTERRVPEALPLQSPQSQFRWALVALVAVCVGALAWLLARAMRRLRALPPPMVVAEIGHADSVLEKDVVRPVADEQSPERASTADEAVAAWRRLSAEEGRARTGADHRASCRAAARAIASGRLSAPTGAC